MKRTVNYIVDMGMLVSLLICGITGIIKFPELNILMTDSTYLTVALLHDWSGIALVVLAALHTVLHAKWLVNTTVKMIPERLRKLFSRKRIPSQIVTVLGVAVLLQFSYSTWARGHHMSNATIPQGIDFTGMQLTDGTYTGTADGYAPGLTVSVTVAGGEITDISYVSHSETLRWFVRVDDLMPDRIITAQSTDVDTVSGATASCHGIMSAVENALVKARG